MKEIPILEGILDYLGQNNAPFSMPGHKAGRGFLGNIIGEELYKKLISADITEVEGLDNLQKPVGIIKEAQLKLSQCYGSFKSYFLVNGSTSGNLAMIFSVFNEGDKIIIERNCHKSIFNAIIMRKLNPIYINNIISKKYNAPLSLDVEHFFQVIKEHGDAKGIVLTYPNYYGIATDLTAIIHEAKKLGMMILIDSAHGAHFGITNNLPDSAVKLGADIVVMSAHKTLPSLTQTAYLHAMNTVDIEKLEFYINAFSSTSPSYMFLASLDYARNYLQVRGKEDFEKCIMKASLYKEKINAIKGFHILGEEDLTEIKDYKVYIDNTRYILNVPKGYSGHLLLKYLKKNKVQCEMSDNQNVVLILSPFNTDENFDRLYEALLKCDLEDLKSKYVDIDININKSMPQKAMLPYEVMDMPSCFINFDISLGFICSEAVVPYPPGIPIVLPGEIINENIIDIIKYCLDNGIDVLGVYNNKIKVVDN